MLAIELMTIKKKRELSPFYDGMDPEIREALLEIQADRKAGKLKAVPRKASDCHTVEDLCFYVFKLAQLDGSCQMLNTAAGVERWVWMGREFNDRLVSIVEEVASKISNKDELKELRLVATQVTANGAQRLRCVFPKAKVNEYTAEDDKRNWQLSQAAYNP